MNYCELAGYFFDGIRKKRRLGKDDENAKIFCGLILFSFSFLIRNLELKEYSEEELLYRRENKNSRIPDTKIIFTLSVARAIQGLLRYHYAN